MRSDLGVGTGFLRQRTCVGVSETGGVTLSQAKGA
jgi:hypothetical protein